MTTLEADRTRTDLLDNEYDRWIPAGYYSPDFEAVANRELDRLAALQPNWDAQGAQTINAAIIDAARTFITSLPANLIRPPKVVPMAKGNLQFEWHDGPRSLELEIEDPQTVHYLKWNPEEEIEETGTLKIADVEQAQMLIRWLARGVLRVGGKTVTSPLLEIAEQAVDMGVADTAEQHDHYIYGTPKRRG